MCTSFPPPPRACLLSIDWSWRHSVPGPTPLISVQPPPIFPPHESCTPWIAWRHPRPESRRARAPTVDLATRQQGTTFKRKVIHQMWHTCTGWKMEEGSDFWEALTWLQGNKTHLHGPCYCGKGRHTPYSPCWGVCSTGHVRNSGKNLGVSSVGLHMLLIVYLVMAAHNTEPCWAFSPHGNLVVPGLFTVPIIFPEKPEPRCCVDSQRPKVPKLQAL